MLNRVTNDNDKQARAIVTDLLAGRDPGDFLETDYGRNAVHVPDVFDPASIFTIDELDALIRVADGAQNMRVLVREPGKTDAVPAKSSAHLYERASKGDSIQVVGLNHVLPDTHPMMRIFRALEDVLQAQCRGITAFVAAPGEALPIHHDEYEVFTLHLSGRKTWNLYEFAAGNHKQGAAYDVGEPLQAAHLAAGHVLYTPKNMIHHVLPSDGLSLSLALVFEPETWLSVLRYLQDRLEAETDFWKSIGPDGIGPGLEARRETLVRMIQSLDANAFQQDLLETRRTRIKGLQGTHLEAAFAVEAVTPQTPLRRRPGPPLLVRARDGKAFLVSAFDEPIEGPLAALEAFRFMANADGVFTAEEISDALSEGSKMALVRKLMRRGIVQPAPTPH